ncbi:MAG TPA: hypothetical protein VFC21_08130 [Bryobacteraceae bacterium]|nr:hypothetical protein [Bryobacteraceae bacterium]
MVAVIVVIVACAAAVISLFVQWQARRAAACERASLLETFDRHKAGCAAQFEELRQSYRALEASLQSTKDVLRSGRLNRSSRSQALHLLRSGMSPQTAASALGVASREMQLLAKVSRLLIAN